MPTLNNWSVTCTSFNPYLPPEAQSYGLQGVVSGHATFPDGAHITTSSVKSVKGVEVTTASGSIYTLGTVDPRYEELFPDALNRLQSKEV